MLLKVKLSKIIINLCHSDLREMNKLITGGILKVLMNQLHICVEPRVNINIIWALNNICSTSLKFRNKILSECPEVFSRLNDLVHLNSLDTQLHFEAVFFTFSMLTY